MGCTFSQDRIEQAIAFHRHSCPGLAIGIRAAEYGLQHFPDTNPADLVCIAETAMCALDAIQFFTGCTTGKGNLKVRDHGKTAFSFYDRRQEKVFRFLFSPSYPAAILTESHSLAEMKQSSRLSADDAKRITALREKKRQWLMEASLDEIFTVEKAGSEVL